MGFDWYLIWRGLSAFLTTGNPYTVNGYFYPPTFTLLFSPLGLLPQWLGFLLLLTGSLTAGFLAFGKRFAYWLPFTPVLYVLLVGNVDLLFVSLAAFIRPTPNKQLGRRSAAIAAIITIKPQLAIVLLPFVLGQMLRENRGLLVNWLAYTALLWGIPMVLFPDLMRTWLTGLAGYGHQGINTPSLWAFSWAITPALIALLCIALLPLLRRNDERLWRSVLMCVSPVGYFYGTVALIECAPPLLLIPVSVIAGILAERTALPIWWSLVPMAALGWQLIHRRMKLPIIRQQVKSLA